MTSTPFLLALWAVAFLLVPGAALSSFASGAKRWCAPERIAWAFALGSAALGSAGLLLHHLGVFSWWWAVVLLVTIGAALKGRRPGNFSLRGASLFWALVALTLLVELAMTWPAAEYAYGQDPYFWTGLARQVALSGGGDLVPSIAKPAPSGYGFLLATAATFAPELHRNPSMVFWILLWTFFSACAAFALARRLAGPTLGAIATLVYLGSYWSLYVLVPAVSRQSWALGIAPMVFLVLVRKGHRAFRSPEIYLLLSAAWLMHAFTALLLLCCLPPLLFQAGRRLGFRALEKELGPLGTLGALLLLALPLVVLGRFFLAIPGILRFWEHPNFYVMKPLEPWELVKTLGPATLLVLGFGALSLREGFEGARGHARMLGLWLLLLLGAIGFFHQIWYRSASVALPPHRYYLFYSLVALVWSGGLRVSGRASHRARRGALAALAALAVAQLLFHAVFVRRMLTPLPDAVAMLEATKWIESRTPLDEVVVISFSEPGRASQARHLLSPRPVVVLPGQAEWSEALDKAAFLITDRALLPQGYSLRFRKGSPPVSVLDLRRGRIESKDH